MNSEPRAKPGDKPLSEAIRRIVAVAHPRRIILFGSAARGESRVDSDLDFLVVVDAPVDGLRLSQRIHEGMIGLGTAVDIVVVTEVQLAEKSSDPGMIYGAALSEGKEVYAAVN